VKREASHGATISGISVGFQIQCRDTLAGFLLFAGLAFSLHGQPARANPGAEGEPAFGISAHYVGAPRLLKPTPLRIRVWGEDTYGRPVVSVVRVSVPDGIEVVSGDTVHVTRVSNRGRRQAERRSSIVIRPTKLGSYVIRGSLRIDAGEDRGVDETEFVLPLEVRADTVLYARAPRVTRFENVRGGQRYRYAGRYLVPIDTTEALLEEDIDQKPRPSRQEIALCPACPGPLPTVIPLVVMVGSDGVVRETRFLDLDEQGAVDPASVEAARRAVEKWVFEPARAGDRPVADYTVVRVSVRAGAP
jgi:hypothetical protein